MKFILGKKIEMAQKFGTKGEAIPFTAIKAGPCMVVQIKTKQKDGYQAVQIGFEEKKTTKPLKGQLKEIENFARQFFQKKDVGFKYLKEFQPEKSEFKRGDKIDVSIFKTGEKVEITGYSKGKGFQGVVKRHHFAGSPKTHGHKDQLRMPGSIGSTAPQRVFKGLRMAGRMGGNKVTIKKLEIVEVIPEKNLLLIKGAVPGARNSLLEIKSK